MTALVPATSRILSVRVLVLSCIAVLWITASVDSLRAQGGLAAERMLARDIYAPSALQEDPDDVRALPMAGCIAYGGSGFSSGVLHMLAASPHAAYCLPLSDQYVMTSDTKELDHVLAGGMCLSTSTGP